VNQTDFFVTNYLFSAVFKDELDQLLKSTFRMVLTGSFTLLYTPTLSRLDLNLFGVLVTIASSDSEFQLSTTLWLQICFYLKSRVPHHQLLTMTSCL